MNEIHNYSNKIKVEKGISCGMYGLYCAGPDHIYGKKIHIIALGYDTEKRMNYTEARKNYLNKLKKCVMKFGKNADPENILYEYCPCRKAGSCI